MRDSKTFLWMDQTKINLFYRKTQGRVHAGKREVISLPNFKGPNIHVICPVSEYQMIHTTRRRGAFKSDTTWVLRCSRISHLQSELTLWSLFVTMPPCHSKFEECVNDHPGSTVCRLGPYYPMLNPSCGDNLKQNESSDKTAMRVPQVQTPSGWTAAPICWRINSWIHGTNYCTRNSEFVPDCTVNLVTCRLGGIGISFKSAIIASRFTLTDYDNAAQSCLAFFRKAIVC